MALALVPVAFFAAAVQLGAARNDSTLETVGRDATRGITVAQDIKLNIAELDEIVVQRLLDPAELSEAGFPTDYDDKREELHDNLVAAAAESSAGAAYRQPLINIEYALSHYHTLVRDAFAARARGDIAEAAVLYGQAHDVIDGTLLSEADFVDKANTYVLNDAYDTQTSRSAGTSQLILVSCVVLVVFLVVLQLVLARKFRRLLNAALLAATVIAAASGAFALSRLNTSADDARRAPASRRSTRSTCWPGPGPRWCRPASPRASCCSTPAGRPTPWRTSGPRPAGCSGCRRATSPRSPPRATSPRGAGGFLARVVTGDSAESREATQSSVRAFGGFLTADAALRDQVADGDVAGATAAYEEGEAFTALTDAVDDAQDINQSVFDEHVSDSTDAAALIGPVSLIAAGAIFLLVVVGLYQRLREYRT